METFRKENGTIITTRKATGRLRNRHRVDAKKVGGVGWGVGAGGGNARARRGISPFP